jgi:hypothetical protein
MREIRQSGSEGGVADNGHPYPYTSPGQGPGIKNLGHFGVLKERCRRVDLPIGLGAMRRSFRTHPIPDAYPQGFTLGWYALPRWGKGASEGR